jgi:hypothetical protein
MVALLQVPNPFRIDAAQGAERRMFPRKEVHARIDGIRHDNTIAAHQRKEQHDQDSDDEEALDAQPHGVGGVLGAIADHLDQLGRLAKLSWTRSD